MPPADFRQSSPAAAGATVILPGADEPGTDEPGPKTPRPKPPDTSAAGWNPAFPGTAPC